MEPCIVYDYFCKRCNGKKEDERIEAIHRKMRDALYGKNTDPVADPPTSTEKMSDTADKCGTCVFFEETDPTRGRCHGKPPCGTSFPIVYKSDYCADYEYIAQGKSEPIKETEPNKEGA